MYQEAQKKQFVFVCGAPRSGTTALASLISALDNTHIGQEIFPAAVKQPNPTPLTQASFDKHALQENLSHKYGPSVATNQLTRFEKSGVIGDKHPHYHRHLPILSEAFPSCHFVFIYRDITDVARSFQRRFENPNDQWNLPDYLAVHYWCDAATNFLTFYERNIHQCSIVSFENLFASGSEMGITSAQVLRNTLASSLNVGSYASEELTNIFENARKISATNKWTQKPDPRHIFKKYSEAMATPKWNLANYQELLARLNTYEINCDTP